MKRRRLQAAAAATAALLVPASIMLPAEANGGHHGVEVVTDALDGPRGVDYIGRGRTIVAEADGTFSLVKERRRGGAKVVELGAVPATGIAPAVDVSRGNVWILTTVGEPGTEGQATLYRWRAGWAEPKAVADIAAYQAVDIDEADLEGVPDESNPYGLAALRNGSVLVADAAGNDLLRVWKNGKIRTVARLLPRTVEMPEELPDTDPEGNPLPPAGTPIPSEGVATSVTVGSDGYWYVGELRGFPATPGTSQIWRIRPGSLGAVCDPERPRRGSCHRYADGLTSIVDLDGGRKGILALSLSKMSWLQMELGTPGAEIGGLFKVRGHGHTREVTTGDPLVMPGGVDAAGRSVYVTSPLFGPGSLLRVR